MSMSIKQIVAMFAVGSRWRYTNTAIPKCFGQTVERKLVRKNQKEFVWESCGCQFWMTVPEAFEVIEARDGFLKVHCDGNHPDPNSTRTYERLPA